MAHLTLVLENREVRKFVLNHGITTIGRAQDNDIVINNLALSRRHAQVEYVDGKRVFEVIDLQSQNGVYVNGERISSAWPLENEDKITVGTYQFVFFGGEEERPKVRRRGQRGQPTPPSPGPEARTQDHEDEVDHTPLLVLKYNDLELQRFPLGGKTCMVGRGKDCEVQIAERRLSRNHCQVFKGEGDKFYLKDLGSQNGTYVNRRRIRGFYELKHRDVLNFAEYSILYLEDASAYAGPDNPKVGSHPPPAVAPPDPELADKVTVMPEAYNDGLAGDRNGRAGESSAVLPVEHTEDPEDRTPRPPVRLQRGAPKIVEAEPFIDPPGEAQRRAVGRQKEPPGRRARPEKSDDVRVRSAEPEVRAPAPPSRQPDKRPTAPAPPENVEVKRKSVDPPPRKTKPPEAIGKKRSVPPQGNSDVADTSVPPKAEEELKGWYDERNEKSRLYEHLESSRDVAGEDDEDSQMIPRSKSSVSLVLNSMTVDRGEIERNLRGKAPERRFQVEVRHKAERIFSGPLTQAVTILGTDREADIPLKGRYVAGRHSLLVRVRDSLLLVRLGSSSVARVNGQPKLQAFLKSGDTIQIDETEIRILEE